METDINQQIQVILVENSGDAISKLLQTSADTYSVGVAIRSLKQHDVITLKIPYDTDTVEALITLEPDCLIWVYDAADATTFSTIQTVVNAVPKMSVIFVSQDDDKEVAKRAVLSGVRSWLVMPIDPDKLYAEIVRNVLQNAIIRQARPVTETLEMPDTDNMIFDQPLDDVQFTTFAPRDAAIEQRHYLLTYVHTEEIRQQVVTDAQTYAQKTDTPLDHKRTASELAVIERGTPITVVPMSDALSFEPPLQTKAWHGEWSRYVFDFTPQAVLLDEVAEVQVSIQVAGIEIAQQVLTVHISEEKMIDSASSTPLVPTATATPYERIFISYAKEDKPVAEAYNLAKIALGKDTFWDSYTLPKGDDKQAALAHAIDEAARFQLFWSANAEKSHRVKREWQYALAHRCEGDCSAFVRAVHWQDPIHVPTPPDGLSHLHLHQLALKQQIEVSKAFLKVAPTADVVAIYSAGTGTGKTTIAANLAAEFAQSGKRTLLIDCALPFGTIDMIFNVKPNHTMLDLMHEDGSATTVDSAYDEVIQQTAVGVDVLLAPARLKEGLEFNRPLSNVIPDVIQHIEKRYDVILVDLDSALNSLTANMLDIAQKICLVTEPTLVTTRHTRQVLQLVGELGYKREKITLILNKAVSKTSVELAYLPPDRIQAFLKVAKMDAILPKIDDAYLAQAITRAKPIVLSTNPATAPLRDAIKQLALQLIPTVEGIAE